MEGHTLDRSFAAVWRRAVGDPSLPRLQAAGDHVPLTWWVRDGRIVIDSAAAPGPDGEPAPSRRLTRAAAPAGAIPARPGALHLPPPPNRLIGRDAECTGVRAALATSRLVTLTGPPGIGKTRLALQIANEFSDAPLDGAVWVDLSGTKDPDLVAVEVAAKLGVQQGSVGFFAASEQQEDRPLAERLADKLGQSQRRRHRPLLLVLDNCEHLLGACRDLVAAILRLPGAVRVLCTSREPLDLPVERRMALRPLQVPDTPAPTVDDALASDAVELFCERAYPFTEDPLSDADLLVAARICQRLRGVPYAIEIAAVHAGAVPLAEILERLDRSGDLPWNGDGDGAAGTGATGTGATGGRDARDDLSTRAMVGWSYQLLSPDAQLLMRRLSVFRGGFGLDAAAHVGAGGGLSAPDVARLLQALTDSSLVVRDPYHSPPRFALTETAREHAAQQLERRGEAPAVRHRHRQWFLRLAELSAARLGGPDQVQVLDELDLELDNLRAALDVTEHLHGHPSDSLRLACGLHRFWIIRGHLSEGRRHLRQALAATGHDDPWRAWGLAVASKLANYAGDLDSAHRYGELARSLAGAAGDPSCLALALQQLGIVAYQRGRLGEARSLTEEALRISRRIDDPPAVVVALNRLGGVAEARGDMAAARSLYMEALSVARRAQDAASTTLATYWLGQLSTYQGRFDESKEMLEEALSLARRLGFRQFVVLTLVGLGTAAYQRGDLAVAESTLAEALEVAQDLDDRTTLTLCLAGLADVHTARGDTAGAERLLGGQDPRDPHLGPFAQAALYASRARLQWRRGDPHAALALHRQAIARWTRLHELRCIPNHLEEMALIARATGDPAQAAALIASAADLRRRMDSLPPPPPALRSGAGAVP